jgi:hypothetical protein
MMPAATLAPHLDRWLGLELDGVVALSPSPHESTPPHVKPPKSREKKEHYTIILGVRPFGKKPR